MDSCMRQQGRMQLAVLVSQPVLAVGCAPGNVCKARSDPVPGTAPLVRHHTQDRACWAEITWPMQTGPVMRWAATQVHPHTAQGPQEPVRSPVDLGTTPGPTKDPGKKLKKISKLCTPNGAHPTSAPDKARCSALSVAAGWGQTYWRRPWWLRWGGATSSWWRCCWRRRKP